MIFCIKIYKYISNTSSRICYKQILFFIICITIALSVKFITVFFKFSINSTSRKTNFFTHLFTINQC
nr:MAG TPA: hypothetical protein [Caudoviricetes sp.]